MSAIVLGVDPGFAHIGMMAIEHLFLGAHAVAAEVIVTKAGGKKRNLRQESDDTRRLEVIRNEFVVFLNKINPAVVAMERVPRIAKNPTTTRQCALGWSCMWTIARERSIPVLVYEPEDIKYEICKDRSASKAQMVKALKNRFPAFEGWPITRVIEHVADAGGAALLARLDPVVELALGRAP